MTLPSNTALHIDPSAFMPKVDIATLRKRLFPPQAAPRKRAEPKPVLRIVHTAEACPADPLWKTADIWFRAHVDAWLENRSAPMKSYIKRRCLELGVRYIDIIGGSRRRAIIIPKHTLVYEVYVKFQPSYPELAALFGLKDHTSPLHIVQKFQKHGKVAFNKPMDHAETIKTMWADGKTLKQISIDTGCCESSVYSFIKTRGWIK